jgi:ubiquinone/menaquinone biosynthesis C-methylase UbiE
MSAQGAFNATSDASEYDRKAEEYNWRGPEVAFGLAYAFVSPGESVLDIGIGTGLGSFLFHKAGLRVYGMDVSAKMLAACRQKQFTAGLKQHDLTAQPYPYETASLNHAVCMGVLHFFADLRPVFGEVERILRDEGIFVFIVENRIPGQEAEYVLEPEYTETGSSVTMYRHGMEEVSGLLGGHEFALVRGLEFIAPMNREGTISLRAKAYVARRKRRV